MRAGVLQTRRPRLRTSTAIAGLPCCSSQSPHDQKTYCIASRPLRTASCSASRNSRRAGVITFACASVNANVVNACSIPRTSLNMPAEHCVEPHKHHVWDSTQPRHDAVATIGYGWHLLRWPNTCSVQQAGSMRGWRTCT